MDKIVSLAAVWSLFFMLMVHSNRYEHESKYVEILKLVRRATKYDRVDEVNRECGFVLDSAAELRRDDNMQRILKDELYFENGDWRQDLKVAPLLTFDNRRIPNNSLLSLSNLASFWVTDVNRHYDSNKSIYISGFLQIEIGLRPLLSIKPFWERPLYLVERSPSQLFVSFQGIYTESQKNHGERVMCLLGSTLLPSQPQQPLLATNDQILLVLRFPRKLTLRSRVIRGIMKSMNNQWNPKYFDEVHISSRLGSSVNYEFTSEALVSEACDPYPANDSLVNDEIDLYKGSDFCDFLQQNTKNEAFTISRDWKCNGTGDSCSKFGPFATEKEINSMDVKLFLQDVRCDKMTFEDNNSIGIMKISLVLRLVTPYEDEYFAVKRTGISNLTLFADGIWKSSSGQICMVGCIGGDGEKCDTRFCLYLPLSFSVNQRSLVLGTLSSTSHDKKLQFYPLRFEKLGLAAQLWKQHMPPLPYYMYSKIGDARLVRKKDELFNLGSVIKKLLFTFSKIEDIQQFPYSLSCPGSLLTFPFTIPAKDEVIFRILFSGPLLSYSSSQQNISSFAKQNPFHDMSEYMGKHFLLKVSGQLNHVGNSNTNFSSLFVEGIYDPLVGKLYLIGCYDVNSSLDCSVEVVISYPPTDCWLCYPETWISVNSKRDDDDPLYFRPIKHQSVPKIYWPRPEDFVYRRDLETYLTILTLSVAISCILSQLVYVRDNPESAIYVSLVMFGVQALGYWPPLITGTKAIFRKVEIQSDVFENYPWIISIDNIPKVLSLAAFLLTLRLFHEVRKSRAKVVTQAYPHRVNPNEKKIVLFSMLIVHVTGFILVLAFLYAKTGTLPPPSPRYANPSVLGDWGAVVAEYLVLVQDLFLLPQVIANLTWKIKCKPVRKLYYVGMTLVRLVPYIYYQLKLGFPGPTYRPEHYELDVTIVTMVVLLAVGVYVQQRWRYEMLTGVLAWRSSKCVVD